VKGHEWLFMAHLASYLTLFAIVVFLLGGTVHIVCFSSRQAFNLKVHIRPAPSGNAFYATSLPILERPLALNNHVTHGGLPIPLSSALSLPAYTNFLTAVRIFTDAVDASAGGAVVPCKDLQGERASFYTSNYKLSDILALLDGSSADHLLIYLSTPTSKSRELGFEQRVRVAGELVPVRFQAFILTNQSTVWASPPPVPLRADEVARVREQWAASYEEPNWFLDQVLDDSKAAEGAPPVPMAVDTSGSSPVGHTGTPVAAHAAPVTAADGAGVVPTPAQRPALVVPRFGVQPGLLLPARFNNQQGVTLPPQHDVDAALEQQMMACHLPGPTPVSSPAAGSGSPPVDEALAAPPSLEEDINLVSGEDSDEISPGRLTPTAPVDGPEAGPGGHPTLAPSGLLCSSSDGSHAAAGDPDIPGVGDYSAGRSLTLDVEEGVGSSDEEEG